MKNNKNINNEKLFCPICGEKIEISDFSHKCNEKILKKIDEEENQYIEEEEINRTFDDKLQEFEEIFDNETYYENDDKKSDEEEI